MSEAVVKAYYDKGAEGEDRRLTSAYGNVEYRTTCHLLDKYFPGEGHILDLGCGTGRYSTKLAADGYKVSLMDLSQNELTIAERKMTELGYTAEGYYCQSATDLRLFEDATFDGVMVMGPLYHLHGEVTRKELLAEVKRVLKPGGRAVVAFINMWGILKASLYEFPLGFYEEADVLYNGEIKDFEFKEGDSFTDTYFTTPPGAIKLLEESGFEVISYAGAESFLSGMFVELANLSIYQPTIYKKYLEKACELCEHPQYRDATEHLHIIIQKA